MESCQKAAVWGEAKRRGKAARLESVERPEIAKEVESHRVTDLHRSRFGDRNEPATRRPYNVTANISTIRSRNNWIP